MRLHCWFNADAFFIGHTQKESTMSKLVLSPIALVAGALIATAAHASPTNDASYETYRHVVLGDSSARVAPVAQPADGVVPGPYAQYLVYTGVSKERAIEAARARGESPTVQRTTDTQAQLNPLQEYQRATGQVIVSSSNSRKR